MTSSPVAPLAPERAFYVGIQMAGFLVGANTLLACLALLYLHRKSSRFTRRQKIFYSCYSTILSGLLIIAYVTNALMGQLMWIDHRDVPGGPSQYLVDSSAAWWNDWGTAADIVVNIMGDGFLLWRCYTIYGGDVRVVAFPFIVFLAMTAFALLTLIESAHPAKLSFFIVGQLINFAVPWVALSSGLNVIITALIVWRILRLRNQVLGDRGFVSGNPDTSSLNSDREVGIYTGVVSMLIESALPLSVLGVVTSVLVGINNFVSTTFICVWGVIVGMAPMFIIVRIAMGLGWTQETSHLAGQTSIVFAPAPVPPRSQRTWTSTLPVTVESQPYTSSEESPGQSGYGVTLSTSRPASEKI